MRPIDADELLARMRERCDSCPHNGNREHCLNLCEWREAIDEVEDMPEIEARKAERERRKREARENGNLCGD